MALWLPGQRTEVVLLTPDRSHCGFAAGEVVEVAADSRLVVLGTGTLDSATGMHKLCGIHHFGRMIETGAHQDFERILSVS